MNLHDAARAGNLPEVKALLEDRPDLVFSKELVGGTALHCAAQYGHKDVAELLLANRADVDAREDEFAAGLRGRCQCQKQDQRDAFALCRVKGP
jgi:ankyrin repeat protein